MSVRVAASAGFCFGVDRAVGLVEQTVREGKRAVTLGPIIHNHHVVQHFAALGVQEVASPADVLHVGDEVDVKIVDIDYENHKISLSIRALLDPASDDTDYDDIGDAE